MMETSTSDDQIRQIETLINSKSKGNKSLAYSTLLHFQAQYGDIPSSLETLVAASSRLVSLIVADVTDDDEEIAAQALKCLGFMIYHPSLVNNISGDVAGLVLEVLTSVIRTTKIKSVCNLGAWCISMQQFSEACLGVYFDSVLRAVVHALDNPFGSLSTTFEAIQAVTKLAVQASEKMRETSHIWAPPIYRRLLNVDKRERDICQRCLLKIKSSIVPPPTALSKAVGQDMKQKLLTQMKDLLNQGMKVRTLQAWGWFVRLLGSCAMKNKSLTNDLLKIPEQTFSDQNPQVQIASQAAWEGLVDALIGSASLTGESNNTFEKSVQPVQTSVGSGGQIQVARFLKRVKLIMTPLLGVISSKCDVSVQSSCLNTWYYLLRKLDTSVNNPLVIELVLEPICQIVFQIGPASKTIWLWAFCLDLLDDFVLAKSVSVDIGSSCGRSLCASVESSTVASSASTNCLYKQHYVRWLAWDIHQLDFFLQMIDIIFSHALIAANSTEIRNAACGAALRIFRSFSKGLQVEFKSQTIDYKKVLLGLNKVLSFLKRTCDCVDLGGCSNSEVYIASVHFLDVVIEELEPFILESPLYKLALDLSWIANLQLINEARYYVTLNFTPITYMGMVSPLIYVLVLYIGLVLHSTAAAKMTGFVVNGLQKLLKFLSLTCNPMENIGVIIYLLYKHVGYQYLQIWVVIAQGLRDCFDCVKLSELESGNVCYLNIYHLLSYPFIVVTSPQQKLASQGVCGYMERDHAVSETKVELKDVTEVWKLLYAFSSKFKCSTAISFHEDLCSMLNACIVDNENAFGCDTDLSCKDFDLDLLTLLGSAVMCVLERVKFLAERSSENQNDEHTKTLVIIESSLELTARFLQVSWGRGRAGLPSDVAISRVLSALAHLVRVFHVKQTIFKLIEVMTCPLLSWLSHVKTLDKSTDDQVIQLWTEILNCLTWNQPPIVFNTTFLKLQAPLLEKTLNHPNSNISEPTVAFWNSTFGEQTNLDYPESLLDLLDKLFRSRKINLQKKHLPFFVKCNSGPENASQMYRATATSNRRSKRVGLAGNKLDQHDHAANNQSSSSKRRRLELTEHQKEVRRAQQGRGMDSNGHGPGIRTYTSVDFSQGNEDSQE